MGSARFFSKLAFSAAAAAREQQQQQQHQVLSLW
jgi:hypothetical protein